MSGPESPRVAEFGSRKEVLAVQMAGYQRALAAGHDVISSAHLLAAAAEGLALHRAVQPGPGADRAQALADALDAALAGFEPTETAPPDGRPGFTPLSAAAQKAMDQAGYDSHLTADHAVLRSLSDTAAPDAALLCRASGVALDDLLALQEGDVDPSIVALDLETFDEAVARGITVVDLWADWCRPCVAMLPALTELARLHPEVTVARVDVEAEPELRERLGARSVPVTVVFRDGGEVVRHVGACGLEGLERLLASAADGPPAVPAPAAP